MIIPFAAHKTDTWPHRISATDANKAHMMGFTTFIHINGTFMDNPYDFIWVMNWFVNACPPQPHDYHGWPADGYSKLPACPFASNNILLSAFIGKMILSHSIK